jgi:hypothetical protein
MYMVPYSVGVCSYLFLFYDLFIGTEIPKQTDEEDIPPPKPDFSAPPPYEVATKLPTYEEVQREKTLEGERTSPRVPLAFLAIDTESPDGDGDSGLLGTDFMFFTAFLGKLYAVKINICDINIEFCDCLYVGRFTEE